MKKLFVLCAALALVLSLCGCPTGVNGDTGSSGSWTTVKSWDFNTKDWDISKYQYWSIDSGNAVFSLVEMTDDPTLTDKPNYLNGYLKYSIENGSDTYDVELAKYAGPDETNDYIKLEAGTYRVIFDCIGDPVITSAEVSISDSPGSFTSLRIPTGINWSSASQAISGDMNLAKSDWYLIKFKFTFNTSFKDTSNYSTCFIDNIKIQEKQ